MTEDPTPYDARNTPRPDPELDFLQARILGVLVEKRLTVPDTYPLTLNALVAGCNQKTSRDPVIETTESEVRDALDGLRRMALVIESSGGRAMRYAENVKRVYAVPSESVSLLATLVLRGPQTAAELRLHSERLQRFSDLSAVEGFLDELAARSPRPLVRLLPRRPGARESRWTHLLTPQAAVEKDAPGAEPAPDLAFGAKPQADEQGARSPLEDRVEALERQVAALADRLDALMRTPGEPRPD